MISKMIGQGKLETVKISVKGKIKKVKARIGIFNSSLGIFTDGNITGCIAVPFWENQIISEIVRKGRQPVYTKDTKIFQVVKSIFHALRQTYHILYDNYGISFQHGKKQSLVEAISALESLNLFTIGFGGKTSRKDKKIFQKKVKEILDQVGISPRDQRKKEVKKYLEMIENKADQERSVNPGAIRAQTIAVKIRLQDLVNDILSIEHRLVARRQVLISIIEYIELHLKGARHFLELLLKPEYWQRFKKDDSINQKRVQDHLIFFAIELGKIDIEPFALSCQLAAKELKAASNMIKKNKYDEAYRILSISKESLKRRAIRTDLERTIMRITLFLLTDKKAKTFTWQKTIAEVEEIIKRLDKVDETDFVQPACQRAITPLMVARAYLLPQKVGNVELVRDYLKDAADPL